MQEDLLEEGDYEIVRGKKRIFTEEEKRDIYLRKLKESYAKAKNIHLATSQLSNKSRSL